MQNTGRDRLKRVNHAPALNVRAIVEAGRPWFGSRAAVSSTRAGGAAFAWGDPRERAGWGPARNQQMLTERLWPSGSLQLSPESRSYGLIDSPLKYPSVPGPIQRATAPDASPSFKSGTIKAGCGAP